MSQMVVKKALQLFDDDLQRETEGKQKKKKKLLGKSMVKSTNKKGVQKQKRSGFHSKQHKLSLQGKRFKPFEGKRKESTTADHTKDNLNYLQQLAAVSTADDHLVHKITSHSSRKILKKPDLSDKKPKHQESVFSERDFDQFKEEYGFWSK